MRLAYIPDPQCYSRLSLGVAIPEVARRLNLGYIPLSAQDTYDKEAVLFTESATLRNFKPGQLRKQFPKAKIINLASDTILSHPSLEISCVEDVDIWLDTFPHIVEEYGKNRPSYVWDWTFSEAYVSRFVNPRPSKDRDFVCLMKLNSPYRQRLKTYLDHNFTGYVGQEKVSSEDRIIEFVYACSWVVLGTTSPAGQQDIRTMKGWRDWIGPFCGTLLIYDDHPEIIRRYNHMVPTYKYDDFDSLANLIREVKSMSPKQYQDLVEIQKTLILDHSLEKQLIRILEISGCV